MKSLGSCSEEVDSLVVEAYSIPENVLRDDEEGSWSSGVAVL